MEHAGDGRPVTVRLPRFLVSRPVGAGEIVKRVSTAVGIRPCGGCAARARRLDARIRLRPWD